MEEENVFSKLLEVQDLPTLPVVMNAILMRVEDETSSASDIAALIQNDHAISVRILRLANSAFYGLRNPVDSISRAIVVLGFDTIKQLALATAVFSSLAEREQFALDPEDFWVHSLGTAKASQLIAERHCPVESPEGCFTAGLLHDIGKYLMALVLKIQYRAVVAAAKDLKRPLWEVEKENLHTTHSQVGKWITTKWRFPPLISNVIANIYKVDSYVGADKREVAIVALGNDMACLADYGLAGDMMPTKLNARLLHFLGLDTEIVNEAIEDLRTYRDATLELYNLLSDP